MRRRRHVAGLCGALMLVAGCAGTATSSSGTVATTSVSSSGAVATEDSSALTVSPADPQSQSFAEATDVVDVEGGSTNPLCELVSTDEVSTLLGAEVGPPVDAELGSGCRWAGIGNSSVQIKVLDDPAGYAAPSATAGFEQLSGIGTAAFVVPEAAGWSAGAQTEVATFTVAVSGGAAGKASATDLLGRLVERY